MRTSFIRIIIGMLALGSASRSFSQASIKYLKFIGTAGMEIVANVDSGGRFITPPMKAGTYYLALVIDNGLGQAVLPEDMTPVSGLELNIAFDKELLGSTHQVKDINGICYLRFHTITASINGKYNQLPKYERKLGGFALEQDTTIISGKLAITMTGRSQYLTDVRR